MRSLVSLRERRIEQWDQTHRDPGSWAHLAATIPDLLASGRYAAEAAEALTALAWAASRLASWEPQDAFMGSPEPGPTTRRRRGQPPRFDLVEVTAMVAAGEPVAEVAARHGVQPASMLRRAEKHARRTGDTGPLKVMRAAIRSRDRSGGAHTTLRGIKRTRPTTVGEKVEDHG